MNFIEVDTSTYQIGRLTYNLLIRLGTPESIASYLNAFVLIAILATLVYVVQYLVRNIIRKALKKVGESSKYTFFEHLLNNRFAHFLALIAPFSLVKNSISIVFADFPKWIPILDKITDAYMVLMVIWMIMSLLSSGADLLKENPAYRKKPLESYLQVIKMIFFLFGLIIIFSIFTGKSPVAFFTAMGAMSAVLLLMFKDTIMGFVASIQVTTNDMVRIGDWVTMNKYGADGDVIEINLTTVKVQNFDRTITTIPTYALTADSFQNWRGMQQSGGRRIKRSLHFKQSTVRFIKDEEINDFKKIQGISDYIIQRSEEIRLHNENIGADRSIAVNGRNMTNLGLFRAYINWYLRVHPGTNKGMTMMVRQLAPTDKGLPLELYVFTATTKWVEYENIMSDIFDHLIASAKYFDLEILENTSDKIHIIQE